MGDLSQVRSGQVCSPLESSLVCRRGLSGERRRGLGQAILGSVATEAALKSNSSGRGRPGEDMWDSGDMSEVVP